ncbi:MAG: tetratricopeptide repeat protein [Brevundimonas sp.]|uniref:tetratricopeptide repeat protein n=1 Tax=Brevundimonas sp. TaxID=1871086 RepID=UPI0030010003
MPSAPFCPDLSLRRLAVRALSACAALSGSLMIAGTALAQDRPPPPPPPPPPTAGPTDVRVSSPDALARERLQAAVAARDAGDMAVAEAAFVEAAAAFAQTGRVEEASAAWVEVARLRLATGRSEEADQALATAVAVIEAARGPSDPALVKPLQIQGRLFYIQGRYEAALVNIARARALLADRTDTATVAELLFEEGRALDALGRFAEAESAARVGLGLRLDLLGPDDPLTADTMNQLANALMAQGRFAEAEPVFRRALGIYEVAYGRDSDTVALVLSNLGNVLRRTGRMDQAEAAYARAVGIAEGVGDPFLTAQLLNNYGWYLHLADRDVEAQPVFERVLALALEVAGPEHPFTGIARANLAITLSGQGRHAEALPLFAEALAVLEPGLGADSPDLVTTLEGRALALAETGDDAMAEALYQRSQAIVAARLAPGHPEAVRLAGTMADFLSDRDRPGEALAVLRPARRDLFARSGMALEGGDPLRRAAPLFAQQVRASWDRAEELADTAAR